MIPATHKPRCQAFCVKVRTAAGVYQYPAIARHSCDCITAAVDLFGPSSVSVTPIQSRRYRRG